MQYLQSRPASCVLYFRAESYVRRNNISSQKTTFLMENKKSENGGLEEKEKGKPPLDIDVILLEVGGQFGLYQMQSMLLAIVAVIFTGWVNTEYVFSTARIGTRCFIPECDNADQAEFSPSWILNAVPGTSSTNFNDCNRFANISSNIVNNSYTCPSTLFDHENVVPCKKYVYENTNTVVFDFDLGCDEWHRSIVGSLRMLGYLVALPLTGFVSDRWGRSTALAFNAFNTAWLGLIRYWANSYTYFIITEILESTLGAGVFSCAYVLAMELVGPKYRVAAGATISSSFAFGQMTLGLIAWATQNWRKLTLSLYTPQLITISYFWIMSESVRWQISKGRYEDSERILKKVAKMNNRQLSEKSLKALKVAEEERKGRTTQEQSVEPWLPLLVFQHKQILIRCVVTALWWFSTILIYYGLSVSSVNMSGNQYLNYAAVAVVEIPGHWTSFSLIRIVGRKPVLIGAFWVCAACQTAYIFMPDDLFAVSLTVYLVGKYSIAMVAMIINVYTAELYPTKYRHRLYAFSSMVGRIGGILAPLMPALGASTWEGLPFVIFAGFALLSGCSVFFVPETLGFKLSDTLEESLNLGKQKPTSMVG